MFGIDCLSSVMTSLAADWLTLHPVYFQELECTPDRVIVAQLPPGATLRDAEQVHKALDHVLPFGTRKLILHAGLHIDELDDAKLNALGLWRISAPAAAARGH